MKIIKINATESTNLYLKSHSKSTNDKGITAVQALCQTQGRGQMGTSWQAEDNKNLITSYLLPNIDLEPKDNFKMSILVSLALKKCLENLKVPDIKIKWPNDILSCQKKIAGILIENTFTGQKISSSIIGIGLNLNQKSFDNLPQASSLSLICQKDFNIDEVFQHLNVEIEAIYKKLIQKDFEGSLSKYYNSLYGYQEEQVFKFKNGQQKKGMITSIENNGFLNVKFNDNTSQSFDLKEIKQVY